MNTSQKLYEQAYHTKRPLTPEQENGLSLKYAVLYAHNVVKRKLHGLQINEMIRRSEHAEEYAELPRISSQFSRSLSILNEKRLRQAVVRDVNVLLPRARVAGDILEKVIDKFDCHPSQLNTKEAFRKLKTNGLEMKDFVLAELEQANCCDDIAREIRKCVNGVDCGRRILKKLYAAAKDYF